MVKTFLIRSYFYTVARNTTVLFNSTNYCTYLIINPYHILNNCFFFLSLSFTFSRSVRWRTAMNPGYPRTDSLSLHSILNGTPASSTVCLPDVLISTLTFSTSGMIYSPQIRFFYFCSSDAYYELFNIYCCNIQSCPVSLLFIQFFI